MSRALELEAELVIRALMTKFGIDRGKALELYQQQRRELIDRL